MNDPIINIGKGETCNCKMISLSVYLAFSKLYFNRTTFSKKFFAILISLLMPLSVEAQLSTEFVKVNLGKQTNRPFVDKHLYVGAEVDRFQFRLATSSDWPRDLIVKVYDRLGTLVVSYSNQPTGPTPVIRGNIARLVISTNHNSWLKLDSGQQLIIDQMNILSRTSSSNSVQNALPLSLGVEVIGYTGSMSANFYIDITPSPQPYSLYLSPFKPSVSHRIYPTLKYVLTSPSNEFPTSLKSLVQNSSSGDTGIYKEIISNAPQRLYLKVDGHSDSFYFLTVQRLKEVFGTRSHPLVAEMDGRVDGVPAPPILVDDNHGALPWAAEYDRQIDAFITDYSTYNRRAEEVLIMGSAALLAATEGYFRYGRVTLYDSLDSIRNVDITFDADCGRANAKSHGQSGPIAAIQLWRQELHRPAEGATTLLHEWGHYHWAMHDEYIEGGSVVDFNSCMGHQANTIEFCGDWNHFTNYGEVGPDSAWKYIQMASGVRPPRPKTSSNISFPQNQATYLDVLHQLNDLMNIKHEPNSNRTTGSTMRECSAIGSRCRSNTDCTGYSTSRCDTSRTPNRCIPDDGKGKIDQYCTNNSQCINNNCVANKCKAPVGIGSLCRSNAGCLPGLACDPNQLCSAGPNQAKDGEYCSNTNQCSTKSYCPSNNSTCRARGGAGTSCAGGGDRCLPGFGCDGNHRCFAGPNQAKDGEYCSNTNQCSTNSYCTSSHGICKHRKRVPKNSLGSNANYRCTSNDQCRSGYCDYPRVDRCYPAKNTGHRGDFCVENINCLAGRQCELKPGKSYGFCN